MKIGDVNTGVTYYFPVTVKEKKEDKFSTCIVDTDGGEWDEFDVGQLVTRGEIISGATDERLKSADDQVDFWKRDSESAHEEIRKLQKLLNSKEEGVRKIEEYADQLKKIADDLGDENEKLKAENVQVKQQLVDAHELLADANDYTKECDQLKEKVAESTDTISRLSANKVALTEEVGKLRETIADRIKDLQKLAVENNSMMQEIESLRSQLEDAEQISSDAIATSNNRKYQIAIIEEVIVALVEKIRRLEGGET